MRDKSAKLLEEAYKKVQERDGRLEIWVKGDQNERNEYKNYVQTKFNGDYRKGAQAWAQMKNRPTDDVFNDKARLDAFMKADFDFNTFDEQDWNNYWLLAQHCDKNREFQKKALDIIEQYLGTEHSHYKYLYDRLSLALTGKQKYGTQNAK